MTRQIPFLAAMASVLLPRLRRAAPELLILSDDFTTYSRFLVLLARQAGIRTATPDHALYTPGTQYFIPSIVDELWSWGENNRICHIQNGVPPERIRIAGNPYSRILVDQAMRVSREEARRQLGVRDGGPLVLFLDSAFGASLSASSGYKVMRIFEHAVRSFRRLPGYQLRVKCHPGTDDPKAEGPGGFEARAAMIRRHGPPNVGILPLDTPLGLALRAADVALVTFSTTGYEAALVGVPAVFLDFFPVFPAVRPYRESGGMLRVQRPSELPAAIRRVCQDDATRRDLEIGRRRLLAAIEVPPVSPREFLFENRPNAPRPRMRARENRELDE